MALKVAGKIPDGTKAICDTNEIFIDDIKANRFSTSHDASESSGYTFTLPSGEKIGICTDLGIVTEEVRNSLTGVNTLLFESNHDIEMLRRGPYPPELKLLSLNIL